MKNIKNVKGFTLLELMIVVAILGIMAAIAYPSFQYTLAINRAKKAESDITKTLAYSRSQAISQNKYIGICPMSSTNPDICASSNDECPSYIQNKKSGCAWTNGFIVYIDQNKNNLYDNSDEIIQQTKIENQRLSISLDALNLTWSAGGLKLVKNESQPISNTEIIIIPSLNMSQENLVRKCNIITTGRVLCP